MSRFNVLLLGAGPVNFGTTEGPWNHTKRLEQILKERLNVVGVVDKNAARADSVLAIKRQDATIQAGYANTIVFDSLEHAGQTLADEDSPHLIIDGLPPALRGSSEQGHNTEMRAISIFPNAALFVEKPISIASSEEVDKVADALEGRIVSVGYMLRYLHAVQTMKKIIEDNQLQVMLTTANYFLAYAYGGDVEARKTHGYWDNAAEKGPVVSQGTHLCDLIRYLSSKPLLETLRVHTVESSDPAGKLSKLKLDETKLPSERHIPRVTNAIWRTENGGTANFIHGIVLHEGDYDVEVTVLADGWKLRLVDPYGHAPRLHVRRPGSGEEVLTTFTGDDCYLSEFEAIIGVIDGEKDTSAILSSYKDAVETYKFTWAIRLAGEKSKLE